MCNKKIDTHPPHFLETTQMLIQVKKRVLGELEFFRVDIGFY
jgi:hypothetical protein